jgi:hypothetical protein
MQQDLIHVNRLVSGSGLYYLHNLYIIATYKDPYIVLGGWQVRKIKVKLYHGSNHMGECKR